MGHRRHQGIACHSAPIGTHHKRGDRVSEEHQHQPFEYAGKFAATLFTVGIVGVGLDFVGINPVKALYWIAVINGLLAPFLLVAILVIASDNKLMQGQPSSRLGWTVVAITTVAMFAAGVAMFVV